MGLGFLENPFTRIKAIPEVSEIGFRLSMDVLKFLPVSL